MKIGAMWLGLCLLVGAGASLTHLQLTRAEGESEFPALAWTGQKLAVAWMDGRDGNMEIYVNSADLNARTLGEETRITHSKTWDNHPRITWTGSEFGLSFIHERKTRFDLMFMKLDREARPLGNPRAVISQSRLGKDTDICFTGVGYGIVYSEFAAGGSQSQLMFVFVDRDGKSLGPPVSLTSGPGIKVPASLMRSGSDFAVVYYEDAGKNAHFMLVDPFGKPRGEPVQINLPGTDAGMTDAAIGQETILAAWTQETREGQQVMVRPLSLRGNPLTPPQPVTEPGRERPSLTLAAGPDKDFGIAWIEINDQGRALMARRLDQKGKPLSETVRMSAPRPVKVMSNAMDMVADDRGFVIAWVDVDPPINTEVILSRVSFGGKTEDKP